MALETGLPLFALAVFRSGDAMKEIQQYDYIGQATWELERTKA